MPFQNGITEIQKSKIIGRPKTSKCVWIGRNEEGGGKTTKA